MRVLGGRRRLLASLVAAGGLASWALADLVPGKGNQKSNCYVEYNVHGITNPSQRVMGNGGIVACTDGEACDTDGVCGNHACTLQVAICIDQRDSNVPQCTPPNGLDKLKVTGKGKTLLQASVPQLLEGSACGAFVNLPITIPVNSKGKLKKKFQSVEGGSTAKAPKGTKPRDAMDTIEFRCYPRTVACPATTP